MLKKLYLKYKEIVDYLFWGGMAFVLYMALAWIFTHIVGWSEVFTTVVDNAIVIIFAFFTNKLFVFHSKTGSIKGFGREFVSFVSARLFTFVLNVLIVWVGSDLMGFDSNSHHLPIIDDGMIVQLIAQVVVIVTNYVLSKLWIFKGKSEDYENTETE